jgi:hypothetical protein
MMTETEVQTNYLARIQRAAPTGRDQLVATIRIMRDPASHCLTTVMPLAVPYALEGSEEGGGESSRRSQTRPPGKAPDGRKRANSGSTALSLPDWSIAP